MSIVERWIVRCLLAAASEAEWAGRLPTNAQIAASELRALLSSEALRLAGFRRETQREYYDRLGVSEADRERMRRGELYVSFREPHRLVPVGGWT